jgi:hypothetical protein
MRIKWFFLKKYGSKSSAEQLYSHLEKVKKKDDLLTSPITCTNSAVATSANKNTSPHRGRSRNCEIFLIGHQSIRPRLNLGGFPQGQRQGAT